MTEDKMVGWHHRLNGQEFEYVPGVGDGQRGLMVSERVRHDWATVLNCALPSSDRFTTCVCICLLP